MNHPRGIGRGRSHSIGRGCGRYHGRRNYGSIRRSATNQEKELKSPPQVQVKENYATYATVKEALVQKFQNT